MTYELDAEGVGRLEAYFEGIGTRLGEKRRRASFALYAMGILGEHERKSVEPLAAAAADDPEGAQRAHDHLLHFIGQSEWEDGPVREFAARHAVHAMESRERISAWVIDDTGFMKQGRESPGVQRQYTGSVGKVANCQIGVSLTLCTPTEHVPVDMQLYLPESWTSDRARCDRAKIPRDIGFRPKWRIALEMMEHAVKTGLPKGVALADAAYGNVGEFRAGLRWLDFEYAVGVNANTVVTRASKATTRLVADVGRGAGAHAPTRRVPGDDVEAGKSSRAVVAFRHAPGRRRQRRWRSPLAAHRVARRREGADPLHARTPPQGAQSKAARADHQGTLAHRARLPRPQGRARARPLRGTLLPRLASPRHRRPPAAMRS